MLIRDVSGKLRKMCRGVVRSNWNAYRVVFVPFAVILITTTLIILSCQSEILLLKSSISAHDGMNMTMAFDLEMQQNQEEKREGSLFNLPCSSATGLVCDCNSSMHCPNFSPPLSQVKAQVSPYHNWQIFDMQYREMLEKLKIFVYPDISMNVSSCFASIFRPQPDPLDPKIGNYFSEHAFKRALLKSPFVTQNPEEAQFFFLPFSINAMRNHPLLHSETSISDFVARYILRVSSEFTFWNMSGGANHFFVSCHSVGREAASKHFSLRNDAIQITCSSSYFQRLYTAHKDIALPQVWPRKNSQILNPPDARHKLVFFAGRVQNSRVREELIALWGNDSSFSIFTGHPSFPYEEGFRTSKFCLHVKGYEVNTARISDAIHYGCVPVLISNHYDLPFANILDWSKFSIIVNQGDISLLKYILTSVSKQMYLKLFKNLSMVRRHFRWHDRPTSYDSFHMTVYQLWTRRGLSCLLD